jgi:hypothetical protein
MFKKLKKLISIAVSMVLFVSITVSGDTNRINNNFSPYSYISDEQILCTATLKDNFCDNSISIIYTKSASRDNRDFTNRDFRDIGAVEVEDIVRLSDKENVYAQELWRAERDNHILRNYETMQKYESARYKAEENTIVNFDQFRRILVVRLEKNCKKNVLDVIAQLQQRKEIYYVGPNYTNENSIVDAINPPNDHYYNTVLPTNPNYQ